MTLAGGGYLDNAAGGKISAAGTGVLGTTSANTVVNAGTITGGFFGVDLGAGGSVGNTAGLNSRRAAAS